MTVYDYMEGNVTKQKHMVMLHISYLLYRYTPVLEGFHRRQASIQDLANVEPFFCCNFILEKSWMWGCDPKMLGWSQGCNIQKMQLKGWLRGLLGLSSMCVWSLKSEIRKVLGKTQNENHSKQILPTGIFFRARASGCAVFSENTNDFLFLLE